MRERGREKEGRNWNDRRKKGSIERVSQNVRGREERERWKKERGSKSEKV